MTLSPWEGVPGVPGRSGGGSGRSVVQDLAGPRRPIGGAPASACRSGGRLLECQPGSQRPWRSFAAGTAPPPRGSPHPDPGRRKLRRAGARAHVRRVVADLVLIDVVGHFSLPFRSFDGRGELVLGAEGHARLPGLHGRGGRGPPRAPRGAAWAANRSPPHLAEAVGQVPRWAPGSGAGVGAGLPVASLWPPGSTKAKLLSGSSSRSPLAALRGRGGRKRLRAPRSLGLTLGGPGSRRRRRARQARR